MIVSLMLFCTIASSAVSVNQSEIKPVTSNRFPYLVSIIEYSLFQTFTELCQSALISEIHVLTSSQCMCTMSNIFVLPGLVGEKNLTQIFQQRIPIIHMVSSNTFYGDRPFSEYSILLLVLQESIQCSKIKPAVLKRSHVYGEELSVLTKNNTGYGRGIINYHKVVALDKRICKEMIKEGCQTDYPLFDYEFCTDRPHHLNRYNRYMSASPVEADEGVIVSVIAENNEDMHGCPGIHLSIASRVKFIEHFVPDAKWID